ncbi:hypothetical protein K0B04_03635 [Patescibacteria group bacterium]|nr:hypothetical protein [Patescibacteria group bacterium]
MRKTFLVFMIVLMLVPNGIVLGQSLNGEVPETLYHHIPIGVGVTEFEPFSHPWENVLPEQAACLVFNFEGFPSQLIVERGWFFGDTLWAEYNGNPVDLQYYSDPMEAAYQIEGFVFDNPETLTVCTKRVAEPYSVEIGFILKVSFVEDPGGEFKIFLPLVFVSPPTLTEEREITKISDEIKVSFPQAQPGQRTCVNFTWDSSKTSLNIDSGWVIGNTLEIILNGNPVNYSWTQSGLGYNYEVKKTFTNPQGPLEICTTRFSGTGTEIGLRAGVQ